MTSVFEKVDKQDPTYLPDYGVTQDFKNLIDGEHPYDLPCFRKKNGADWICAFNQQYCNDNKGGKCIASGEDESPIKDERIIGNWEMFGHKGIE